MENRERDRVGQRRESTDGGRINRDTEERIGHDDRSSADFGREIGRAENLREPEGRPRRNQEDR